MAIVALIFGGFLGFIGALTGWVIWDFSLANALATYLGSSLMFLTLTLAVQFLHRPGFLHSPTHATGH